MSKPGSELVVAKRAGSRNADHPRTVTLPTGQREATWDGPDLVTSLRLYRRDVEFLLGHDKKIFSLGSSRDCDIPLSSEYLSELHCVIERRAQYLRVRDQGSRNGTFFAGRRETQFDVRPGDVFTCASTRFIAMNQAMRTAYPTLVEVLGADDEHAVPGIEVFPSDVLVFATNSAHLLITGEPGNEQERLAKSIHAMSLRSADPLVEIDDIPSSREKQREILDRASRATLVFTCHKTTPLADPMFASMLFSASFQIRVIVLAPMVQKASDVFGSHHARQLRHIPVCPLAWRLNTIPTLLERILREQNSPFGYNEITESNRRALLRYEWPDNLRGLRLAATRLITIANAGSFSKGAALLDLAKSSLHDWMMKIGLSVPIVASDT